MFQYIIKRVLIFIPTLLVISLLTFMLSVSVPGDPVELMISGGNSDNGQSANKIANEQAYIEKRTQLGLDLPVFYFSLGSKATSDTLYRIPKKMHKKNLARLCYNYGNWSNVERYYALCRQLELDCLNVPADSANVESRISIKDNLFKLFINADKGVIDTSMANIEKGILSAPSLNVLQPKFKELKDAFVKLEQEKNLVNRFIPDFKWYGFNNQYHRWITKFIKGDFGISYQDGRPVKSVLWDAIQWTLMLSIFSLILTYLLSIPLGINSARYRGTTKDQVITTILFILYSLPSFWIATMLIMFFGGGDYFNFFPGFGVGDVTPHTPFFEKLGIRAEHLFLPMICYTYGSLAFISRQMRAATINSLSQDYVRTARAKGLNEKVVVWKHAFRNSLLPIITLFANIFPLAISGSIVLEQIFSIPGMGKIAIEAIYRRNYPIIFSVVMFSAILTLVGNLVSDILYAVVDPRISYSSKKN
ncbi:MAG: ABC transporter permease [Chitinophagales bacterium]|nr:ABC transporter permease [Chitinophagales bacterium]